MKSLGYIVAVDNCDSCRTPAHYVLMGSDHGAICHAEWHPCASGAEINAAACADCVGHAIVAVVDHRGICITA